MFGSVQRHRYRNPLQKLFYGLIGNPRIAELERAWRVTRAVKKLPLANNPHILDAGCGEGSYSMWLSRRYPSGTIMAADAHQGALDNLRLLVARERSNNIVTAVLDLEHLSAANEYDLIVCVDVMEHIENHQRVISNLHRALKPGGFLVMHVPQRDQRFQFICRQFGPGLHHYREGYLPGELEQMLRSRGFRPVLTEQSYGSLAVLACEVDEVLWTSKLYPVWLSLYPLLLLVAWWDTQRLVAQGQGVLVAVVK